MNRFDFLSQLSDRLRDLSPQDRRRVTDYYSEMIDDRIEEGFSEEEAVQSIGDPDQDALEMLAALGVKASESAKEDTPAMPADAIEKTEEPAPEPAAQPEETAGNSEKNIIEETVETELRQEGRLASEKDYGNDADNTQETASGKSDGNGTSAAGLSEEAIQRAIRNIEEQKTARPEEKQLPRSPRRKKLSIILIAAVAVIGVIASASIVKRTVNFTTSIFPFSLFDGDSKEVTYEDPVESLIIRTSSGDVRFEDSNSKNVTVTFSKGAQNHYKVDYHDGSLWIEKKIGSSFSLFGLFGSDEDVVIGLPFRQQEVWGKESELEKLDIETSSGDIILPEKLVLRGTLNLNTSSGEIKSEAVFHLEKGEIRTSSGDIKLQCGRLGYGSAENLSCRTSSGKIEIRDLSAEKFTAESGSGDVTMRDVKSRDFSIATTSGEVKYDDANFDHDIDRFSVRTTSGDIEMCFHTIPVISISTTSGKVSVSPAYGPEGNYSISTTSGDIKVKSY